MKTTTEYFSMSKEELTKVKNEYGYTIEECKLFDSGIRVGFYTTEEGYKNNVNDDIKWYTEVMGFELTNTLLMTNGTIATIYN